MDLCYRRITVGLRKPTERLLRKARPQGCNVGLPRGPLCCSSAQDRQKKGFAGGRSVGWGLAHVVCVPRLDTKGCQ